MGCDLLDITFRLEKQLGVKLPWPDFWERAFVAIPDSANPLRRDINVERLWQLICQQIGATPTGAIAREARLRFVCDRLHVCCQVPIEQLRPEAPLETLMPQPKRAVMWERLATELQRNIPKLQRHWLVIPALLFSGLVSFVTALPSIAMLASHEWNSPLATKFYASCGLCILTFLVLLRWPRTIHFPGSCRTVGELAQSIVCLDLDELQRLTTPHDGHTVPPSQPWTEADVWEILKRVLMEALAVEESAITPEACLVRDLGCE